MNDITTDEARSYEAGEPAPAGGTEGTLSTGEESPEAVVVDDADDADIDY